MGRYLSAAVTQFPSAIAPDQDPAALAQWLAERAGKLTASRMKDAISFLKNGNPSQKRSDYMRDLLAERATGLSTRHFVTPAMLFGLEQPPVAKAAFEEATGIKLIDSGFYDHPMIDMFGATPDYEIANEGLVEIKVPNSSTFVEWVLDPSVMLDEHRPQCLAQLACTGRKWVDLAAFDPRIKDQGRRLFVRRIEPTRDEITKIEEQAERFLKEVDQMWEQFTAAS